MEAIQFDTKINLNGNIELPAEFRNSIKKNTRIRVIVMVEEQQVKEPDGWKKQTINNFFKDEIDADDVYNNL